MKTKILEIHFRNFGQFERHLKRAISQGKPPIKPQNHVYFDSVEGFRRFMTIQKIELLSVIALHAPASLYELAKRVEREFPAVLKDCTALEALGFIRIQQLKTGRKVKKPVLSFPYRSIAVYFPQNPLEISFRKAT